MGISKFLTAKRRGALPDRFSSLSSVSSVVKRFVADYGGKCRILSSESPLYHGFSSLSSVTSVVKKSPSCPSWQSAL